MSPFPQYNRQSDQTLSEAQLYQFNSFAGFAQDNNTKDLSQSPMPTPTPISLPLHPSSSSSACSFQFDLSEHNSISHHSTPFDHEDDDSTSNTAQASWDSPAHLSSSSQTNLAADFYQQTFGLKQELPVWNMTSSFNNANNTHHNNANTTHEPEKQNTQFACSQQSQNSNQNQNQQSILYSQISVPPRTTLQWIPVVRSFFHPRPQPPSITAIPRGSIWRWKLKLRSHLGHVLSWRLCL